MLLGDFYRKLRKLNKSLRIDIDRIAYPYSQDYPTCGLYCDNKYLMAVPQYFVPKYTICAVNFNNLVKFNRFEEIKHINEYGFIPEGKDITERLLWRGYKAILNSLIRTKYLTEDGVKREFRFAPEKGRLEFPRNFINMNF